MPLRLDTLNSPQQRAVTHAGGPLVVFAGAGSGKTRVITYRVAHLIEERGVEPWRILAVTFTNKAAGEMRERLKRLTPRAVGDIQVGTFHATCAKLLRRYADQANVRPDFTIYDDADQRAMITRILRDLSLDDRRFPAKQVAGAINWAKQEVVGPAEFAANDVFAEQVRRVYEVYEQRMSESGALDFGDLIYKLVRALIRDTDLRDTLAGRFHHALVDEFQDTNHAQFRLVQELVSKHRNPCVVGDDDQSIYRWRGADRKNILGFRDAFPDAEIVKLEQNYRSTKRILRIANTVIARNVDREPKQLWTENSEGAEVLIVGCEDERDEARMVTRAVRELLVEGRSLSDIAVFYRIHAQSRVLEEAMRADNIAYRIVGGMRFYERAEVKDMLAYLRVLHNPSDEVSLLRIINTPARGIGKTTIDRLLEEASRSQTSLYSLLLEAETLGAINPAARKKLADFVEMLEQLRSRAEADGDLMVLGEMIMDRTGYLDMLREEDTPEADARIENVQEFVGSMGEFQFEYVRAARAAVGGPATEGENTTSTELTPPGGLERLGAYLEQVTLQTDTDAEEGKEGDRLTLMTVHAAKGLEFDVAFVSGLEEKMFPFRGAEPWEDVEELEEERRLAYVAFTRARERLVLSYASIRRMFGDVRVGQPSRFIVDLPPDDVRWIGREPRSSRPPGRIGSSSPSPMRHRSSSPPQRERSSRETSYVDSTEGSDLYESPLRKGMRVRHPKFGVGRVRGVLDGMPVRVSVEFPDWGTKSIVATFLEPV